MELMKLAEMYTSRSHVLNCELYKILEMKVDEIHSVIGEDEDAEAMRAEIKRLRVRLAFSEDVRTRAMYDVTKAQTIQKTCVVAQKKAESQLKSCQSMIQANYKELTEVLNELTKAKGLLAKLGVPGYAEAIEYVVDRNLVTESKVSSRSSLPKIDAVYDALDDEHNELFINSCFGKLYNAIPRIAHLFRARMQKMRLLRMCSWNSRLAPKSRDIAEVLDNPILRARCTLHASPEEKEEEYVRLFVPGPRREYPILDAYLHEDGANGAAGDEEPDDRFEQVRDDDPQRFPVAQDEHEAGQSSPAAAARAPLQRSRPCYEHENLLRQILEQIKKLTDQVDELKSKMDRSEE
ncbi:hypothetical protein Fot_14775 [Forsythia ovata]|uniref:Uncharacterized protein n=1 Tax=Forsythia ovata TaxID=205694 RepID=A0ABD1W7K0_9LAMI